MAPQRKPVPANDASTGRGVSAKEITPIYGAYKEDDSDDTTMKKAAAYQKEAQSDSDKGRAANVATQNARAKNGQTPIPSYKKGGKIRKTGLARVHKGERMIPKAKVKRVEKAMKSMKRG